VFPNAGNSMTLQNVEWETFKNFLIIKENFRDTKSAMYANKSRFQKLKTYFQNLDFNEDSFSEFLVEMQKSSLTAEYQNKMISMAKNVSRYLKADFLKDFKYRQVGSPPEKILLTVEEIIALIDCKLTYTGANGFFLNTRDHAMLMLFAYTGCRAGEVSNLKWEDLVDEGKRKKVSFKDTKNGDSRTVYLPLQVWQALNKIPRKSQFVFSSYRGKQILNQGINEVLKKRAEFLGIKKNVHAHLLRHSFITEMLDSGAEWFRLAVMVGHKDPKTTQRYYENSTKAQENLMKLHPLNRKYITYDDVANEALGLAQNWRGISACRVSVEEHDQDSLVITISRKQTI
jgi:integrase